jgi:hypothetical protein
MNTNENKQKAYDLTDKYIQEMSKLISQSEFLNIVGNVHISALVVLISKLDDELEKLDHIEKFTNIFKEELQKWVFE